MPTITKRIRQKRATSSAWTAANPILRDGVLGYETNTKKFKWGTDANWNDTTYAAITPEEFAAIDLDDYVTDLELLDILADIAADLAAKEDAITAGTAAQYIRANKTLSNFAADVRAATLTGVSSTSGTITATDTNLSAWGKVIYFISNIAAIIRGTDLTGVTGTGGTITDADTNLSAWGKVISFMSGIGSTIRAAVLTGVVFTTNATIAATDNLLVAFGKLQAQINANATTIAANTAALAARIAATTGDITTGTDNTKYLTPSSWAWIKGQASQWVLSAFAGTGNRIFVASSTGVVSTTIAIGFREITDSDVITAIIGANYNAAGDYISGITPASSKIAYKGQLYFAGKYKYEAILNNVIRRSGGDGSENYINTGTANYVATRPGIYDLPILSAASATFQMPSAADHIGCMITINNFNTNVTYTWSFSGTNQPITAAPAFVTLANQTSYQFKSNGTNWVKI